MSQIVSPGCDVSFAELNEKEKQVPFADLSFSHQLNAETKEPDCRQSESKVVEVSKQAGFNLSQSNAKLAKLTLNEYLSEINKPRLFKAKPLNRSILEKPSSPLKFTSEKRKIELKPFCL